MQQFFGILSLRCYLLNRESPELLENHEGKSGYSLHEDYIQSLTFRAQKGRATLSSHSNEPVTESSA